MAENSTPIVKNGKNIDLQNGLPTITEESYNTEMLLRLCTSESSTIQLLNGVAIKIDTINEAVERRRRYTEARNMIDKLEHLVKLKEAKLLRLQRNYGEVIQYIDKKRRENESRKIKIEKVKKHINCIPKYLGEVEVIVSQSRIILQDSQDSLDRRRSVLVLDLSDIFPINLIDAENSEWGIYGLSCKAHPIVKRREGAEVGAAFGMVSYLITFLSRYLDLHLQNPIQPHPSEPFIYNPAVLSYRMTPKFPLFPTRGVDKPRYEYAVQLLETNLERLLSMYGIQVFDRKQTLSNIKQLLIAINAWASRT